MLALPMFAAENIFLVDAEGSILVSQEEQQNETRLEQKKVLNDIKEGKSGSVIEWTAQGERVIFYQRINSLGWYYVMTGLSHQLLPSKAQ